MSEPTSEQIALCRDNPEHAAFCLCALDSELSRLRAELAEVTKDAERYRWLRNGKNGKEINCTISGAWSAWINGPELDAAIDADIQKAKP